MVISMYTSEYLYYYEGIRFIVCASTEIIYAGMFCSSFTHSSGNFVRVIMPSTPDHFLNACKMSLVLKGMMYTSQEIHWYRYPEALYLPLTIYSKKVDHVDHVLSHLRTRCQCTLKWVWVIARNPHDIGPWWFNYITLMVERMLDIVGRKY